MLHILHTLLGNVKFFKFDGFAQKSRKTKISADLNLAMMPRPLFPIILRVQKNFGGF